MVNVAWVKVGKKPKAKRRFACAKVSSCAANAVLEL